MRTQLSVTVESGEFQCPHCRGPIAGVQAWVLRLQQRWHEEQRTGRLELNYFRGGVANANATESIKPTTDLSGAVPIVSTASAGSHARKDSA
jgi:hypothetical protein